MSLLGNGVSKKDIKDIKAILSDTNNSIKQLVTIQTELLETQKRILELVSSHTFKADIHYQCSRGGEKYLQRTSQPATSG